MRYPLAEASRIICDGAELADAELWVARRLRAGVFPGLKIGRAWFMTDQDVQDAIENCRRGSHAPAIPPAVGDSPAPAAVSITDGLSARARKLRAS